jgi:hypothetical protein
VAPPETRRSDLLFADWRCFSEGSRKGEILNHLCITVTEVT